MSKEMFDPRKFNPRSVARNAILMTLPAAAAFTACGDGPTQSGMPQRLETPTQAPMIPVNPTPFELTVECVQIQGPRKSIEQVTQETIMEHGGAIVLTVKGIDSCTEYVPFTFRRLDAPLGKENFYNNNEVNLYGNEDGTDVEAVIPATSCDGIYEVGVRINKTQIDLLPVLDEKTGEYNKVFTLDEDCTKKIETVVDRPTLN